MRIALTLIDLHDEDCCCNTKLDLIEDKYKDSPFSEHNNNVPGIARITTIHGTYTVPAYPRYKFE